MEGYIFHEFVQNNNKEDHISILSLVKLLILIYFESTSFFENFFKHNFVLCILIFFATINDTSTKVFDVTTQVQTKNFNFEDLIIFQFIHYISKLKLQNEMFIFHLNPFLINC